MLTWPSEAYIEVNRWDIFCTSVKFGSDGLNGISGPTLPLNASISEDRVPTDVELRDLPHLN
jgi:hypothetical protein